VTAAVPTPVRLLAAVVVALLAEAGGQALPLQGAGSAAPARPVADGEPVPVADSLALLRRAAATVQPDDTFDERYAYRVERRSHEVSALGKVTNGPVRVYDVAPSPVWPELIYRRLVAVEGRPLSAAEAARLDERHRREARHARERREMETPAERNQRLRRAAKARREAIEGFEDFFRVYELSDAARVRLDGFDTVVVTLTPRAAAEPRTDLGRQMKKWAGRAWTDVGTAQLVRIEVEAREDVTFGLGVIGRIHQGSRAWYRRAPLADGAWVPVEAHFAGSGKTLMLRPFQIETWARYSAFQRLPERGATGVEVAAPAPPDGQPDQPE
jgi:hypothetical protein